MDELGSRRKAGHCFWFDQFAQRSLVPLVIAWVSLLPACRDRLYEQSRGLPNARLSVSLNEATSGSREFILHVGVANPSASEFISLTASGGLTLSFASATPATSLCSIAAYDQVFELFATPTADNLSVVLGTSLVQPDGGGGADLRPCSELAGFRVEEPVIVTVPAITTVTVGMDAGRSDAASGQVDASQVDASRTDSGTAPKEDAGPQDGRQTSTQDASDMGRTQNDATADGVKDR